MSIKRLRHKHSKEDRQKHEEEQAARLAPLEEIHASRQPERGENGDGGGVYSDGSIKVDSSSVKLAGNLTGDDRHGTRVFHLEPVVVVILLTMLAFIAFIAWQITLMPEKTG